MSIPPEIGRRAWQRLHAWADDFASEVQASGSDCGCGEFAQSAARALHDTVSAHLGKPVLYPEDLRLIYKGMGEALETTTPANHVNEVHAHQAVMSQRDTTEGRDVFAVGSFGGIAYGSYTRGVSVISPSKPEWFVQTMVKGNGRNGKSFESAAEARVEALARAKRLGLSLTEQSQRRDLPIGVSLGLGAARGRLSRLIGLLVELQEHPEMLHSLLGEIADLTRGLELSLDFMAGESSPPNERPVLPEPKAEQAPLFMLQRMAEQEQRSHSTLPLCTPSEQERMERCIQEVKARGGKANPWAVCQASLGCRQRTATQASIYPWPERWFEDEEDDEESILEKKEKKHKKAPVLSQSFLQSVLAAAVSGGAATFGAVLVSKFLEKRKREEHPGRRLVGILNDSPKDHNKEGGRPGGAVAPVPGVAIVEGDMIQADLGPLLQDLDKIIQRGDMGEVSTKTLRVTRE